MPSRIKCILILFLLPRLVLADPSDSSVVSYKKSLHRNGLINILAIAKGQYSEVRYDRDGDSIIDDWRISKGLLRVEGRFVKGKLESLTIERRMSSHNLTLIYKADSRLKLNLMRFSAKEFGVFLDSQGLPSYLEEEAPSTCYNSPMDKALDESGWKDFISRTTEAERRVRVKDLISQSCDSLSSKDKMALQESLNAVYAININTHKEDNKFINCLALAPATQPIVPKLLSRLLTDLNDEDGLKFTCKKSDGPGCAQARYVESGPVIELPAPGPMCPIEARTLFDEKIWHESLHRLMPEALSDKSIIHIVNGCLGNKHDELLNVKIDDLAGVKNSNISSSSSVKEREAKLNKILEPANAASLAGESQKLIAEAGNPNGELNSGFRSVASASAESFNPNQDYRESVARTGPMLAMFEKVANAVVPPANAGSMVWTAPAGSGGKTSAQWLNSSSTSTATRDVGAGVALNGIDSSSARRSPSSAGDEISATSRENAKPVNQKASREVASAGAAGFSKGSGRSADISLSNGAQNSANPELEAKAARFQLSENDKKVVDALVNDINRAKSEDEVIALLSQNHKRLLDFKIYVYDPKGMSRKTKRETYGLPSPNGALQPYTLINGKLVPE